MTNDDDEGMTRNAGEGAAGLSMLEVFAAN
jgi:hypothetical protein